ncbi:hypothetical protein PPF1_55 [Rhizobium phage vB_RleM_PPF1]|uniref:hypothetical protein n=1 Tax=Rhizobium phage vB_RleM_PPF1 TaxID=1498228 RepID=UPI00049B079A|nr:hypothetical protein PPF1_55 [Rhizobium phage vB_RleM_PPF1]AID18368.1 hypothetical protein PPF1_55 [Rhizobium phage vB_RleM_PPF1]
MSKEQQGAMRDRFVEDVMRGIHSGAVSHVEAMSALSNALAWTILLLGAEARDEGLATVIEILPKQVAAHLEQYQDALRRSAN